MKSENDSIEALRAENLPIVRRWMTTLNEPGWGDLIDRDIVLEFPYASSVGIQERYSGRAAAVSYIKALFSRFGVFEFLDLEILGTTDPSVFVSEYRANLTTPRGEPYVQRYINKVQVKDGKVVFMREFWDPKRTLDATHGSLALR